MEDSTLSNEVRATLRRAGGRCRQLLSRVYLLSPVPKVPYPAYPAERWWQGRSRAFPFAGLLVHLASTDEVEARER